MFNILKFDFIATRLQIGILMFTACLLTHMYMSMMSINIIAMVKLNNYTDPDVVSDSECIVFEIQSNSSSAEQNEAALKNYGIRYDWSNEVQGLILGSYFWGTTVGSLPAGLIGERLGPKNVIFGSLFLSAIVAIGIPFTAGIHYGFVLAGRIFMGLTGAMVFPTIQCLITKWSPPNEKSKFSSVLLGGALGTVSCWPLLGGITEAMGWVWAFYIPAGVTILWCILWWYIVSDSPEKHPRISDKEKNYIITTYGNSIGNTKKLPPYKDMFLSIPCWGVIILHFGHLWGLYFSATAGPKFMSEILGFNLTHSGILAALPHLARLTFGFMFGILADCIRRSGKISPTLIRKFFTLFSHILPGFFLLNVIFIGCDWMLAVVLLTLSLGSNGASAVTSLQNGQDLSPNFASTIYGIISCIGGTTGFITPILTSYFTSEHNGLREWHIVFGLAAFVYIITAGIYLFIGSGEEQPWNNTSKSNSNENKTSDKV